MRSGFDLTFVVAHLAENIREEPQSCSLSDEQASANNDFAVIYRIERNPLLRRESFCGKRRWTELSRPCPGLRYIGGCTSLYTGL